MAPGSSFGEVYFIAGMMVLILVICIVAVWAFIKTYKKEMREKAARESANSAKAKGAQTEAE
jgi:cbb3-type cytochrome oxidase subunit 3